MSPIGKSYIGQTNDYAKRCREHKSLKGKCVVFENAIKKWGWDTFEHEILESGLTLEEANRKEQLYIKIYDSITPNGYNMRSGGLNGALAEETKKKIGIANSNPSEETRLKMSASQKTKPPVSEETRLKMSEAQKKRPAKSEETRRKLSESHKARPPRTKEHQEKLNESNTGRKRTEESKRKQAEKLKGRTFDDEHKQRLSQSIKESWIKRKSLKSSYVAEATSL